ncbi:hypothetical protein [Nitrosomonas communis]|uniref:hypothetical protein n=1 Tax=Nitrosomonas communis TaxID=44574 RepID=UPI0026EFDEAC|nr:hypothetical protein [Nitrosomonas communis]MCO6427603.1 hypothetical protein [Nitrosomonas communis]
MCHDKSPVVSLRCIELANERKRSRDCKKIAIWRDCVRKYDREYTLFYCDPPYWGTESYGVDFGLEQYAQIAELAKTIKGKMITSVNDIQEMREAFDGLEMQQVTINYTVGGQQGRAQRSELIIRNF